MRRLLIIFLDTKSLFYKVEARTVGVAFEFEWREPITVERFKRTHV